MKVEAESDPVEPKHKPIAIKENVKIEPAGEGKLLFMSRQLFATILIKLNACNNNIN